MADLLHCYPMRTIHDIEGVLTYARRQLAIEVIHARGYDSTYPDKPPQSWIAMWEGAIAGLRFRLAEMSLEGGAL